MKFLLYPWWTIVSLWFVVDDDPPLLCGCDDGCRCDEPSSIGMTALA